MTDAALEHDFTLWMVDNIPVRRFYAGHRWHVADSPTRLRESVWSTSLDEPRGLDGWRFQGTNDDERSFVFDVYRAEDGWHIHRFYE